MKMNPKQRESEFQLTLAFLNAKKSPTKLTMNRIARVMKKMYAEPEINQLVALLQSK